MIETPICSPSTTINGAMRMNLMKEETAVGLIKTIKMNCIPTMINIVIITTQREMSHKTPLMGITEKSGVKTSTLRMAAPAMAVKIKNADIIAIAGGSMMIMGMIVGILI